MSFHRGVVVAAVAGIVATAVSPVSAQQPTAPAYEQPTPLAAVNCRYVNYYLWPSEPQSYECCAAPEPPVLAETFGAAAGPEATAPQQTAPRGSVTVNRDNPRVGRALAQTCVNLSALTPFERLLRQLRSRAFSSCVQFVVYDHFPCTCETQCNDASWFCDCPGVPPGQLPEIKPQDSIGSQPEFLGTVAIPCGSLSNCEGTIPPEGESPV